MVICVRIIDERLFREQDLEYRDFTSRTVPNINKDKIIGVRLPIF